MNPSKSNFFHVETIRTPRVYFSDNFSEETDEIWLIIHGYGQLAGRFIEKFGTLIGNHAALVVPEAMQRFYLDGPHNKVGASWMTREDRETDIADNHRYLNRVIDEIRVRTKKEPVWRILAFSQGTATACRWLAQSDINPASLTLWAGMWPEDIDSQDLSSKLKSTQCFWILGNDDPYYHSDMLKKQQSLLESWNIEPEVISFEGGHHIDEPTLQLLLLRITS
jgi:predicted esterase